MEIQTLHEWRTEMEAARALQNKLRKKLVLKGRVARPRWVAGADAAFVDNGTQVRAVVVVLEMPQMKPIECIVRNLPVNFPYIPGFLSFREAPALLDCFRALKIIPDVILVDGQGIAHPRRLGIASHLGLWLNLPTIGVAKSRLCGTHAPLPLRAGSSVSLMDGREAIGVVFRSREGVQPLYISPGHKIGIEGAVRVVQMCLKGYRLPEPTRLADKISKEKS